MVALIVANATITETDLGLHATSPEALPFAPSLHIRSFVLPRETGNILIYSTASLAKDAEAILGLGGIDRHYLNHWHEAMLRLGLGGRAALRARRR